MSTSSAKAPNGRSGHQSRVSTSSIPLSFAYGAPALPPQNGSSSHIDAQHSEDEQESNLSGSQRAGSEVSGSSRRESAPASSSTVTGNNAAESRYAKYRKHQQNGSSSSNQISSNVPYNPASHSHTSVNIATAFLNAQRDHQSQFDHSEQSFDLDDTHDSGLADESLQVNLPSSLISSSKGKQSKRKRVASTVGGSESGSSAEDSTSRKQKAKKRKSKAIVEEDDAEEDAETEVNTGSQTEFRKPTTPARKGKPRRKSVKDPSYRPGHSEEEEDSDETTASHSKSSKKRQQPRYSTVTDGSKTPRVLGAYPTPGVQRWQFGDDSSLHDGDNPDSSSNRSATFRLDPPDPRDDASSSNYELEAEHVRAREEAASRSQNVANVVLGNPTPHQQSSANAAGRSLPKPRREVRASGQTGLSIPASQTAHRNRDLGFKPPASDSDGFGPGQQSGESLHAAGLKAGNAVRNALFWLFYPLNIALHLFKSSYLKLSVMQWSTIFQGAAIVMFLAVLIGSLIEDPSWLLRSASRSKPTGTTFEAPNLPPSTFEQLIERLSAVEKATSDLSFQQRDQLASVLADSKTFDSRLDQMSKLVSQISDETRRLAGSAADIGVKQQDEHKHTQTSLATIRNQLDAVGSRVDQLSKSQRLDSVTLASLLSQVEALQSSTSQQDSRLHQLTRKLDESVKAERISALAMEAIEQVLPDRLAVRVDSKNGKVHVDPAFWRYLQSAFTGASGGSSSSKDASPSSWPAFLSANEQNLRSLVESEIQEQVSSGAVLNKRAFMDLLRREIKSLKSDFETKANENVEQIGQEILLKVDRQLQQHTAATSSQKGAKQTTLRFSDGSNTTEVVQSLIDAALLQYSKDVLGRPDYALFTGGARVVPGITSPPLELRPPGLLKRALSLVTGGTGTIRGRPPVTALHPDLSVGSCWAFAGPTAQLGVRLSRKVVVSDITIEHAAREVAYDVSSAPSDFEVWGVVESEDDARRLAQARSQYESGRQDGQLSSIPPSKHHMLLVSGTYDPNALQHVQSFPVFGPASSLDIPVSVVMLRVLGTQGGGNGCLYRFRVGGTTVDLD